MKKLMEGAESKFVKQEGIKFYDLNFKEGTQNLIKYYEVMYLTFFKELWQREKSKVKSEE